jgi:hypothetical protein
MVFCAKTRHGCGSVQTMPQHKVLCAISSQAVLHAQASPTHGRSATSTTPSHRPTRAATSHPPPAPLHRLLSLASARPHRAAANHHWPHPHACKHTQPPAPCRATRVQRFRHQASVAAAPISPRAARPRAAPDPAEQRPAPLAPPFSNQAEKIHRQYHPLEAGSTASDTTAVPPDAPWQFCSSTPVHFVLQILTQFSSNFDTPFFPKS